jgi:hypothetical protein
VPGGEWQEGVAGAGRRAGVPTVSLEASTPGKEKVMSGSFIQGLTDPMRAHNNDTLAYAARLGDTVKASESNTISLYDSLGGEVYQANGAGHENWRVAANHKGQVQAEIQGDGGTQITRSFEELGANQIHGFKTIDMPTA